MVNLDDYYSGGFFLVRSGKRDWQQLQSDLLPPVLISLSECMCSHLEVRWGWNPGDIPAALAFGIPQSLIDEFVEWCGKAHRKDIDFPSMFHSLEAASRFIQRFLPDTSNLYLIEAGLHHEIEAMNWREPIADGEKLYGIEERIEKQIPLALGGQAVGHEVISFGYNDFGHSWLCNYLHEDMHQLFGIRPNTYGLIDSYENAKKVYDWIAEDDMQGGRAYPELYDPWLLVSHPLV